MEREITRSALVFKILSIFGAVLLNTVHTYDPELIFSDIFAVLEQRTLLSLHSAPFCFLFCQLADVDEGHGV